MDDTTRERLEALEARIRRLEQLQSQVGTTEDPVAVADATPEPEADTVARSEAATAEGQDQLEFEVGTVWFSRVGITVLALGAGFGISQPYASLPAYAPTLGALLFVVAILFAAQRWNRALGPLGSFIRGGAMILFYFAVLRLFFFGEVRALETSSMVGIAVLAGAPLACLALAAVYGSAWLTGIALVAGLATALIVPVPWFSVLAIATVFAVAAWASARHGWQGLLSVATILGYATFLLVMLNRPLLGNPAHWTIEPRAVPVFVLLYVAVLAAGSVFRRDVSREGPATVITAFLNGGLGILAFVACVEAGGLAGAGILYSVAALMFLGTAIVFWVRERSRFSTFAYSMTGYLALTLAIAKFSAVPNVFVWLSMQSLVVVATALWFQSRFIVSANFAIYLATIAGYLAVAEAGSGISFIFGVVALASARVLKWQKDRLHLKTEFMRNGYLTCGFLAFPYAAYHLVPSQYVAISWVAIALFYYLMNLAVKSRKYRWMGHATLLGTVLYLIVVGIIQLKPAYRILSFVVLGIALVGVSIVFSILRSRKSAEAVSSPEDGSAG
jgi:hypothetical protein